MVKIEEITEDEEFEQFDPLRVRESRTYTLVRDRPTSAPDASTETDRDLSPPRRADPKVKVATAPLFDPWGLASVLLAVLLAVVVVQVASPFNLLRSKVWTPEELAKYNGSDKSAPLLLAILGSVFDVSRGRQHYGPGGGYHHFTGRDASRAFVSGNFTGDGLTDDLKGLPDLQVKRIDGWRTFFKDKYKYKGTLVGRFYDQHGKPTKELTKVDRQVARAEKILQQQKEDEKRFPSCNSKWNAEEGGQVWCDIGYPRIAETISQGTYKGSVGTRCACFEKQYLGKKGLQVYGGCSPTSQSCQSAPPQVKQN